jgi:hypothetical protein
MHCASTADPSRMGYIGRLPGLTPPDRDSDSWFTPEKYLAAARLALGGAIDLDPYTSAAANERVGARHSFTLQEPAPPGPEWPGVGTCFMNPPYTGGLVLDAAQRFTAAFRARRFRKGVVLVNNATDTRFFHLLLKEAAAVCFTDHRIAFENVDGKRISGNTRGQAFFYFHHGRDRAAGIRAFAAAFQPFGPVLRCGPGIVKGGR